MKSVSKPSNRAFHIPYSVFNILFFTTITSFALSLIFKLLVDHFLSSHIAILGPLLGLQYATNPGVAFSMTFPGHLQAVFITIAMIMLVYVALHAKTVWSRIAFGLILGGAMGNIVDRIFDGRVTDFIQVGTFPIFNVADSCITVGVCLLLAEGVIELLGKKHKLQAANRK